MKITKVMFTSVLGFSLKIYFKKVLISFLKKIKKKFIKY